MKTPAEEKREEGDRRTDAPPDRPDRDRVDGELEESFPSSDPPSHSSPGLA
jgi:hypothetical protein